MFKGIVIHGEKIGRVLGYPTANLDITPKDTKCSAGIYAAYATLKRKKYGGALVINEERKKVEIYLFGYQGEEFYGEEIVIDPVQKVSEIEPHDNEQELKQKINDDITLVKKILKI